MRLVCGGLHKQDNSLETNASASANLVWVPVIKVEFMKPIVEGIELTPEDLKNFVGLRISRFWMAEHEPGNYIATEWEPRRASEAEEVGSRRWGKNEQGAFTLPSALTNEAGEYVAAYYIYSVHLWNDLNNIIQSIRSVKWKLDKLKRSAHLVQAK